MLEDLQVDRHTTRLFPLEQWVGIVEVSGTLVGLFGPCGTEDVLGELHAHTHYKGQRRSAGRSRWIVLTHSSQTLNRS